MSSPKVYTWVRKGLDVARLPRVKLNNIQDLPGAKKKVETLSYIIYCLNTFVYTFRLLGLAGDLGQAEARHVDEVIKAKDREIKMLSELGSKEGKHLFTFEYQNTASKTSMIK